MRSAKTLLLETLWACGAACLAVAAIGAAEAGRLSWVAWPRVTSAVAYFGGAAAFVGAAMALLLAPVRRRVHGLCARWVDAGHRHANERLAWALGLVGAGFVLPRVARRLGRLEESAQVIAWLLVVALTVVCLAVFVRIAARLFKLARRVSPLAMHRWVHGGVYVLLAVGRLHKDVRDLLELLGWIDLGAAVLIVAASQLGPSLAKLRVFPLVMIPAIAVVLGAASWHSLTPMSEGEAAVLWQRTYAIAPAMRRTGGRRAPVGRVAGAGSCWPGELAVQDVGRVEEGAPDILLVMADGVRFDYTSMSGERRLTPHLDRWARQGAVFTRAYAPAPSTRQSFRSLFTGLYPGVVAAPPPVAGAPWGVTFSPEQQTMAGYLREAGYETTALVSKRDAFPRAGRALHGFDTVDLGAYYFTLRNLYSASFIVNQIMGLWAREYQPNRPRFLWTHIMDPHYPYTRGAGVGPQSAIGERQRYEWSIRYLDQELDRLLRWVRSPERRNKTWLVFTSDHGEGWWEHENRRHGRTSFEEEIHVPLLIWGPDVRPGRYEDPVSLVGVLPTLLDAAGLDVPASLCEEGWLEPLRTGEFEAGPVLVSALPDETRDYHHLAWIEGDQKIILDGQSGISSLYDLEEDPNEQEDLAEEQPDTVLEAESRLRAFFMERGMSPDVYGLPSDEDGDNEASAEGGSSGEGPAGDAGPDQDAGTPDPSANDASANSE